MWYWFFGIAMFALIAVPLFPWPQARSVTLGVVHRLVHIVALVAVAGCAVFFCMPDWAPTWLLSKLAPLVTALQGIGPEGRPGFVWLPIGVLLTVVTVPGLVIIDFALRLSTFTAMVRRLLGDIRQTAREMAEAIANDPREHDAATVEHLDAVKAAVRGIDRLTADHDHGTRRRQLIELVTK